MRYLFYILLFLKSQSAFTQMLFQNKHYFADKKDLGNYQNFTYSKGMLSDNISVSTFERNKLKQEKNYKVLIKALNGYKYFYLVDDKSDTLLSYSLSPINSTNDEVIITSLISLRSKNCQLIKSLFQFSSQLKISQNAFNFPVLYTICHYFPPFIADDCPKEFDELEFYFFNQIKNENLFRNIKNETDSVFRYTSDSLGFCNFQFHRFKNGHCLSTKGYFVNSFNMLIHEIKLIRYETYNTKENIFQESNLPIKTTITRKYKNGQIFMEKEINNYFSSDPSYRNYQYKNNVCKIIYHHNNAVEMIEQRIMK